MNPLKHFTYACNILYDCTLLLFLHVHLMLFKGILTKDNSSGVCEHHLNNVVIVKDAQLLSVS